MSQVDVIIYGGEDDQKADNFSRQLHYYPLAKLTSCRLVPNFKSALTFTNLDGDTGTIVCDSKADAKTLSTEDIDIKYAALSKQNKQNNKNTAKLMKMVDEALNNTIEAQSQVTEKRERIFENRKVIMSIRKDIDLFTD